jgi:hypothetical protein
MKTVRFLFHLVAWSLCLLAISFIVLAVIALIKYIW